MGFRMNDRHRGNQMKCQSCEGNMSLLGKFPYRDFDHSLFNFVALWLPAMTAILLETCRIYRTEISIRDHHEREDS